MGDRLDRTGAAESPCRSRRRFLALLLGAVLPVATRCRRGGPSRAEIAEMARSFDPALDCSSTRGLWPGEIRTRTDNGYVDRSATEDQFCFICSNYVEPAVEKACGSCRTVKGPIHPLGWCEAWTAL